MSVWTWYLHVLVFFVFFLLPAEFVFVDLTSLKSVRQFVQTFRARGLPLHVLVNNGGQHTGPSESLIVQS